jgi:outer membrane cobalamin receptor
MAVGRFLSGVGGALCCLMLAGSPAMAADQTEGQAPKQTGQYKLGEVVVQGGQAGVESVGTVREVSAEEIANQGARSLDEALKLVPGLYIRTGAGGVPRIDLRGFRSRHVLLLLNGVPFNSAYDQQFDPTLIPVENIARIKVSYGNHSVLYGPGGMGGVINIITKAGQPGVQGKVNGEVGSEETYLGRFNLGGGADDVNYFLSGGHYQRAGWPLSDDFEATSEQGDGRRENSKKRRNNIYGNVEYRPSSDWLMGLSLSGVNGSFGIPPSTINDSKDAYASSPKYEQVDGQQGYSGQFSLGYQPGGPFSLRSWVYLNSLKENPKRYDNASYNSMSDASVKTYDLDQKTSLSGINAQASYDFKSHGMLSLALAAERSEFDNSGSIRDAATSNKKKYGWRSLDENNHLDTFWGALEYELLLMDKLNLVFGLGSNWLNKQQGSNEDTYNFLAGASYDLGQGGQIKGSIARQSRFPSIRQLYDSDSGNNELGAEHSLNFELGYDQALPHNSTLSVTGFYMDVKDYIERIGDDIFRNYDHYAFSGIEVTAQSRPIRQLWLSASVSYMHTEDKSDNTEKDELQYRPTLKGVLEGKYSWDFGLSLYAAWLSVNGQYYYSRKEPLQKAELGNYNLINFKVTQAIFKSMLDLYVGVDNLLDKNYQDSYGFAAPGRYIYLGLDFNF